MNWLYYLLEANLYLAVFYGFYRLFLHQETFYSINRYFLILVTLVSFALPICKVGYINSLFAKPQTGTLVVTNVEFEKVNVVATNIPDLPTVLYTIYILVAAGFLLRMLISLAGIFNVYFKAKKQKINKVMFVELDSFQSAFSFFNILFINPNVTQKNTVLKHEMIHITQNHSADILFFELIQIISWFSPIVYFIKKDIKLLHEYIADDLTTTADVQKHDYALFLIQNSFGVVPNKLSNQIFNQSLIKRRIKMLNKEKSGGLARFRILLLAPIAIGLLCASTMAFTKDYAMVDLLPEKTNTMQEDSLKLNYVKYKDIKKFDKIFANEFRYDEKSKSPKTTEKRVVVINGQVIKDNNAFGAIANFDEMKKLSAAAATKKYGDRGTFGAVEFTGSKVVIVKELPAPPPPMEPNTVLAPPPPPEEPNITNVDQIIIEGGKPKVEIVGTGNAKKVVIDGVKYDSMKWSASSATLTAPDANNKRTLKLPKDAKLTGVVISSTPALTIEPAESEKPKTGPLDEVVVTGYKTPVVPAKTQKIKEIQIIESPAKN